MRALWAVMVVVVLLPMAAWALTSVPVTSTVNVTALLTTTGPNSGHVNNPSTNFTVTLIGTSFNGSSSVTISDGNNGGTIAPSGFSSGVGSVTVVPVNGNSFTFVYTPVAATTIPLTIANAQGWTENPIQLNYTSFSGSGITYYISGAGSDSNNGLTPSTPIQTCAHLNTFSFHGGDIIAFDAVNAVTVNNPATQSNDCTFAGASSAIGTPNVSSVALSAPLTITSYGGSGSCLPITGQTGTCGKINVTGTLSSGSGAVTSPITVSNVSFVTVENLVITNTSGSLVAASAFGTFTAGIFVSGNNGATVTNWMVANNATTQFSVGIAAINGSALSFQGGFLCGTGAVIKNNLINGLTRATTAAEGIYINGVGQSCALGQALVQGNLIYNIGGNSVSVGNGIQMNAGEVNILDQFNVTHDIGNNDASCGGPAGNWNYDPGAPQTGMVTNIIYQYNESYNLFPAVFTSGCDWAGFDFDGGTYNSIMQYNYAHDNWGAAFLLFNDSTCFGGACIEHWNNNYVRYNIAYNNAIGEETVMGIGFSGTGTSNNGLVYMHNNTMVQPQAWQAATSGGFNAVSEILGPGDCPTSGSVFANNIAVIFGNTWPSAPHPPASFNQLNGFVVDAYACPITYGANDWYSASGGAGGNLQYFRFGSTQNINNYPAWAAVVPNNDAGGTIANPGLTASDVTCYVANTIPNQTLPQTCPSWANTGNSVTKGHGVNVNAAPYNVPTSTFPAATQDYFGNAVPNSTGSGYNIGAYGGN